MEGDEALLKRWMGFNPEAVCVALVEAAEVRMRKLSIFGTFTIVETKVVTNVNSQQEPVYGN